MYVTNLEDYGHLIEPDYFPTKYLHNDMWQMKANKKDWESRYISPLYWQALSTSFLNKMVSSFILKNFPEFENSYYTVVH